MIRYALNCEHERGFEAWFSSSAAFDTQSAAHEIVCPACGSANVSKALMAPAVATRPRNGEAKSAPVAVGQVSSPGTIAIQALARELRAHIEKSAEYVGPEFAEEARKIHYEETPARHIYGEASWQEIGELTDEGITVLPIPALPEEKN